LDIKGINKNKPSSKLLLVVRQRHVRWIQRMWPASEGVRYAGRSLCWRDASPCLRRSGSRTSCERLMVSALTWEFHQHKWCTRMGVQHGPTIFEVEISNSKLGIILDKPSGEWWFSNDTPDFVCLWKRWTVDKRWIVGFYGCLGFDEVRQDHAQGAKISQMSMGFSGHFMVYS